jgi:hypothetical protein
MRVDQSNDVLRQRIDDLTRQMRWHRRGLVILVTLSAGALLMGQAQKPAAPDEVRARRFLLTDAAGATVGSWGLEADGRALFQMTDPRAAQRLSLSLGDAGPGIVLVGPDGKRAVGLEMSDESPRLVLRDNRGIEKLWIALRMDSPAIQFFDDGHVARSGLTTFNDGRGIAFVSESDGKAHGLVLYGKNRGLVWSAP